MQKGGYCVNILLEHLSILIFHKVIFGVEQRGVLMFRGAPSCRKKEGAKETEAGRERKKKKVCVLARVLGARVHYGGVSVSRRALFPHPQAPGPLHNIKKHKQSILNVTQRKSKRESVEKKTQKKKKTKYEERKGFSSVTQHSEIREMEAGL